MKSFWKSFLYVPKHEKIPDKVMLGRVILSASLVVGCLLAMAMSAYAYFAHSLNTGFAVLEAAGFVGEVKIVNVATDEEITVTAENTLYKADLEADEYLVTVSHKGTASSGFFKITAKNSTFHTTQVFSQGEDCITFKIKVNADARVEISANLGTSVYYADYKANGTNLDIFITDRETIEF